MPKLISPPTLVLAGAWNPAILQPEWIARELFDEGSGAMQAKIEVSPAPGAPPRFTLGDLTFVPHFERLLIAPEKFSEEGLALAEKKSQSVLHSLPHTPVRAFGQNFEFLEENPTKELLQVFELQDNLDERADFEFKYSSRTVSLALNIDEHVLNFSRQFLDGNGSVILKFNFHYETRNAAEADKKLTNTFVSNFHEVCGLLDSYHIPYEI